MAKTINQLIDKEEYVRTIIGQYKVVRIDWPRNRIIIESAEKGKVFSVSMKSLLDFDDDRRK